MNFRHLVYPSVVSAWVLPFLVGFGMWADFFQYEINRQDLPIDLTRFNQGVIWVKVGLVWLFSATLLGRASVQKLREAWSLGHMPRLFLVTLLQCGWVLLLWPGIDFLRQYVAADLVPLISTRGTLGSFPALKAAYWCVLTAGTWLFLVLSLPKGGARNKANERSPIRAIVQ